MVHEDIGSSACPESAKIHKAKKKKGKKKKKVIETVKTTSVVLHQGH